MKSIISTTNAPLAIGPYSQAVSINLMNSATLLYTSGQLPIDPVTKEIGSTIEEQTTQSLKNVEAVLKEAGMTFENIIKTTVYLSDIMDFKKMNEIYESFFTFTFPARSAFEVSKLPLGVKVEIEAVAAK